MSQEIPTDPSELFAEVIAHHFDGSSRRGKNFEFGFAGLKGRCEAGEPREWGNGESVGASLWIWGGPLGATERFTSFVGYGATRRDAIITGACNWACVFGQVLRKVVTGHADEEVESFDVRLGGRPFHVFIDGLDRAFQMADAPPVEPGEPTQASRTRLGGAPWIMPRLFEADVLGRLPDDVVSILSLFIAETPDGTIWEVRLNGLTHQPAQDLLAQSPAPPPNSPWVFLRELAFIRPDALGRGPDAGCAERRSPRWKFWRRD